VFTPRFTTEGGWIGDGHSASTASVPPGTYNSGFAVYAPAVTSGLGLRQSILKDGSAVFGEWIEMRTPYAINVTRIATAPRKGYGKARGIGKFIILGSNNGTDWENTGNGAIAPHDISSATDAGGYGTRQSETIAHVSTNSNGYYYTYHRLVVTHIMGHRGASGHPQYTSSSTSESVNQSYLRFFGTREQLPPKQSVLHDGQLTLTKNLTVPSIGPSVTNTRHVVPKRHKLVVEFDTSTNPTDLTTVNDTSEMGNDGTLIGNAYYSIGDKAFKFDGSGDYIQMKDWTYGTGFVHSFSGWVKFKSPEESWQALYGVGDAAGTGRTNFTIYALTQDNYFRTEADGGGGRIDHTFEFTGNMDKWLHVAVVKSGTAINTTRMYINGEILPHSNPSNETNNIALPNTPQNFNLGSYGPSSSYHINADFSNVKFYNTALTAGDVKTLYDMGRGDSYHVTNFQTP